VGGGNQGRALTSASGGNTGLQALGSAYAAGVLVRNGSGLALNDFRAFWDGVGPAADTLVDVGTDIDLFKVGAFSPTTAWNGHIQEIRYYNTRLSDAEVEDLSLGIFPSEGLGFSNDLSRDLARDLSGDLAG